MKKLLNSRYGWITLLIVLAVVNFLASTFHSRIDLTEEKRFTLSRPTKHLLSNLEGPVTVTVFLTGNMPAGFKRLSGSVDELLQEFKETGRTNFVFKFQKPAEGLD